MPQPFFVRPLPYNPSDHHQLKWYAPGAGTILAKPAGEPHPETVSLAKVTHLGADAMAADRAGVLKTELLAYKTSDAYRQTPAMVVIWTPSCSTL